MVLAAALAACTDAKPGATNALPDAAGAPDVAAAETSLADGQPETADAATAGDAGSATDSTTKPDGGTADTTPPADSAPDASTDLVADAVAEVAAPEVKADSAAETGGEVAQADAVADVVADVAQDTAADAPLDAAPDAAADAAADVADAKDGTAAETTTPDVGPAACKAGELKRCWVECPQSYAAGCISGQIPILILGTQACSAGQWGACDVKHQCSEFANGPCQNASKAPQTYLCTDGIPMTGAHICTKPLGANCTLSYYINWPIYDCPLMCKGPDDVCATEGAERDCEVRCGSATGPTKPGKQKCQNVCNGLHWNMCSTGEACK